MELQEQLVTDESTPLQRYMTEMDPHKRQLYMQCKEAYPALDHIMLEAAVDLYLKHEDVEDIMSVLDTVPRDYFLTKSHKEEDGPTSAAGGGAEELPSSPRDPGA